MTQSDRIYHINLSLHQQLESSLLFSSPLFCYLQPWSIFSSTHSTLLYSISFPSNPIPFHSILVSFGLVTLPLLLSYTWNIIAAVIIALSFGKPSLSLLSSLLFTTLWFPLSATLSFFTITPLSQSLSPSPSSFLPLPESHSLNLSSSISLSVPLCLSVWLSLSFSNALLPPLFFRLHLSVSAF